MTSFLYQYTIMWAVFLVGCHLALKHGEISWSGPRARRLWGVVAGMVLFTCFHAAFTPWGTW